MSRKKKAPVRKVYADPKFHSEVVSKFINSKLSYFLLSVNPIGDTRDPRPPIVVGIIRNFESFSNIDEYC